MSTILKALRRLEDQKTETAERPLRDEVVIQPARRSAPSGFAVALTAFGAFAVVGGLLSWLLRGQPAPAPESPVEATAAVAATTPDVAAAAPSPDVTVAPAAEVDDAAIGSVPVPVDPEDFEIVRPDPTAAPRRLSPPPLPRIANDMVTPLREPAPITTPSKYEAFARRAEIEEEAPVETAPRRTSPVRVDRTQWHPAPERRLAWVEVEGMGTLREVREGERVGPYVVREIEPAGVLFSDGSVEVRREVGR